MENMENIDEKSKEKAYELFFSGEINTLEPGTVKSLQHIHKRLFEGLYTFAGEIRTKNISKGNFRFASSLYLRESLNKIETMAQNTFVEIVEKYVEMNIAHPFLEGNGRTGRIWLDQILKKSLGKCIDWREIDKRAYLCAMERSPINDLEIRTLLSNALTDKIHDHETFLKGIDQSYYYETDDFID